MIRLTPSRIRVLYILADGKQHTAEELADALNMKLSNFIPDVLKPLISDSFCCYDAPIKARKRGRPRRPVIIQNGNLPIIAETIHRQITTHLDKAIQAAEMLRNVKRNQSLPIADRLLQEHINHLEKAGEIMELLKIPIYNNEIARKHYEEGCSSEHIIAALLQNVEIITDLNKIDQNPIRQTSKDFHEEGLAREKYYEEFDKKLAELEADKTACRRIKELWNNERNKINIFEFAKRVGYPLDVVDAEIKKMLRCNEIALDLRGFQKI
jgi:hypothetical protein